MMKYFVKSAIGCQSHNDARSCQTLANLCVLSLYDEAQAACMMFKTITESDDFKTLANEDYSKNWKEKMPWLYYKDPEQTPLKLLKDPLPTSKFNLQVGFYDETSTFGTKFPRSKYLNFKLASYSLDGEFIGFQDLSSQLS